jgi:dipeptidyl aminopeptidase/acylaminoacyl peptidase
MVLLICLAGLALLSGCGPVSFDANKDGVIVYSHKRQLMTVNADGSGRKKILSAEGDVNEPSEMRWSPDGKTIAYISAPKSVNRQLCIIDADGRNNRVFAASKQRHCRNPVWSPDGSSIAFTQTDDNDACVLISILNVKSNEQLDIETKHLCAVRFSPDGKRLLISRSTTQDLENMSLGEIIVLDLESRREQKLAAICFLLSDVDWIDNETIIFNCPSFHLPVSLPRDENKSPFHDHKMRLFRMDIATRKIDECHKDADAIFFALSLDRKQVLWIGGGARNEYSGKEVWVQNLESGKTRKIAVGDSNLIPFWVGNDKIAVGRTRPRTKAEESAPWYEMNGQRGPDVGPGRVLDGMKVITLQDGAEVQIDL